MQVTIPSSDAIHQLKAHGALHLPQDVIKSMGRVLTLIFTIHSSDAIYQLKTHGALHLVQDVIKSMGRVTNITQFTIHSSDAIHQLKAMVLLPSTGCNQKHGESK